VPYINNVYLEFNIIIDNRNNAENSELSINLAPGATLHLAFQCAYLLESLPLSLVAKLHPVIRIRMIIIVPAKQQIRYKCELELDNWILTKGRINRGVIYTHKVWKGLPTDILGIVKPISTNSSLYISFTTLRLEVRCNRFAREVRLNLIIPSSYVSPKGGGDKGIACCLIYGYGNFRMTYVLRRIGLRRCRGTKTIFLLSIVSNNDMKEGGKELSKKFLSPAHGLGVLRRIGGDLREGSKASDSERKYPSSALLIYPLFYCSVLRRVSHRQVIKRDKFFGRAPGKYVSTYTKVAGNASIIKFNSQSKVDKLNAYCKNKNKSQTNFILNRKIYNMLYDQNLYLLAREMLLDNKSGKLILTGKDIFLLKDKEVFGCTLLGLPNLQVRGIQTRDILDIIIKMKEGNYNFTNLSLKKECKPVATPPLTGARLNDFSVIKDILVIKAIVRILEAIYEPSFNSNSGSRATLHFLKGVGSSCSREVKLAKVKEILKGASWIIKSDLSKTPPFEHINLNVLMSSVERKITDRRFTDLIRKALNAGHFNYFGLGLSRSFRSLLYPILIDIFLSEGGVDNYVYSLASRLRADKFTNTNYNNKGRTLFFPLGPTQGVGISPRRPMLEDSAVKVSYVREGECLILAVKGSYSDCVSVVNLIRNFFKQNLFIELSNEVFEIINTSSYKKDIIFLGVRISISSLKHNAINGHSANIELKAPINHLQKKLTLAGFLKDKKPVPKLV